MRFLLLAVLALAVSAASKGIPDAWDILAAKAFHNQAKYQDTKPEYFPSECTLHNAAIRREWCASCLLQYGRLTMQGLVDESRAQGIH